MGVLKM